MPEGLTLWNLGTIIGSESFVSKIVQTEEEAFSTGHKTPPVYWLNQQFKQSNNSNDQTILHTNQNLFVQSTVSSGADDIEPGI